MQPARPTVRGLLMPGSGPVVRAVVAGRPGLALLDTGASMSVVDRELARGLPSPGAAEWAGVNADGGRSLAALRTVHVEIVGDGRIFALDMIEVPGIRAKVPGLDVLCLLGWDFLETCRLVCDGPAGAFELTLPPPVRAQRRRR
ncbi:MAG: retroviral-like aspartic protease family protein [Myxococcales bacterium]|nr:retroviral-like aspartic protease family protein [Myxococcales bacterium]MCB9671387.1 retroviral-like aspartic protease family protein [Alphaproteobacteria bacterium]